MTKLYKICHILTRLPFLLSKLLMLSLFFTLCSYSLFLSSKLVCKIKQIINTEYIFTLLYFLFTFQFPKKVLKLQLKKAWKLLRLILYWGSRLPIYQINNKSTPIFGIDAENLFIIQINLKLSRFQYMDKNLKRFLLSAFHF